VADIFAFGRVAMTEQYNFFALSGIGWVSGSSQNGHSLKEMESRGEILAVWRALTLVLFLVALEAFDLDLTLGGIAALMVSQIGPVEQSMYWA
jgi:hypothetical protein